VLFETLAERLPDIALAGEPRRLRSNLINGINGIKEMPVRFRGDPLVRREWLSPPFGLRA
jgi:hypothetical protein